jgi:hypothetical protein
MEMIFQRKIAYYLSWSVLMSGDTTMCTECKQPRVALPSFGPPRLRRSLRAACAPGSPPPGQSGHRRLLPHRLEAIFAPHGELLEPRRRLTLPCSRHRRRFATQLALFQLPLWIQNRVHFGSIWGLRRSNQRISPDAALPLCRTSSPDLPGGGRTRPPINMAFTLFAHHGASGAVLPFDFVGRLTLILGRKR